MTSFTNIPSFPRKAALECFNRGRESKVKEYYRELPKWVTTSQNSRHPRESGDPFLAGVKRPMDSRLRGNDDSTNPSVTHFGKAQ
jgi:hypothetical protein